MLLVGRRQMEVSDVGLKLLIGSLLAVIENLKLYRLNEKECGIMEIVCGSW
jgi:hypothetical protein